MYLSTPEEGGETVFPYAEKKVGGGGGGSAVVGRWAVGRWQEARA